MACFLRALALLFAAASAHAATADHYELALPPDYAAQVLDGHARIRLLHDSEAARTIELPSPNLQIAQVMLDGLPAAFQKTPSGWRIALNAAPDTARHAATSTSTSTSTATPSWLEIDYRAPAAGGLVFGEQHAHTAFHTCQWMPCVGPDLTRATFAIKLDLPAGQRSVASGGARAYPLYTLGFAAGRFTEAIDPAGARLRYLGATDEDGWRTRGGASSSPARAGTISGSTKASSCS